MAEVTPAPIAARIEGPLPNAAWWPEPPPAKSASKAAHEQWEESRPVFIRVEWGLVSGHYEPRQVSVRAFGDQGLTPKDLRRLRWSEIIAQVKGRQRKADLNKQIAEERGEVVRRTKARWQPHRGRPREYDQEHWEEIAKVYIEAYGKRPPAKAVAEHFGVSDELARQWIRTCRYREGLLPEAEPGKAGWKVTEVASGR
jgi:hypothetical protein